MGMRRILAATAAAAMMAGGVLLAVAPAASAATQCPTVNPSTGQFQPRPAPGLDWSGCDLTGGDMTGATMTEMNLTRTIWGHNSAVRAVLAGADLTEATFIGPVNLTFADLSKANLSKAELTGAYVTSTGDTGNLGCTITGTPRRLPTGWALANGCLKTRALPAEQALEQCQPVTLPAIDEGIESEAGKARVWVRGMSCAEAKRVLRESTDDGKTTLRELERVLATSAVEDAQEDPQQRLRVRAMRVLLPDTDERRATSVALRVAASRQAGIPRLDIDGSVTDAEVSEDRVQRTQLMTQEGIASGDYCSRRACLAPRPEVPMPE